MRTTHALAILAFGLALAAARAEILGKKPGYLDVQGVSFANMQAATQQIWMPGLDEDYVPQGLAVDGRSVLVAAYRSGDAAITNGPCRIFRVDVATGQETGHFDAPAACGHAAGLANVSGGLLVLADIHDLWRIDLDLAFATGSTERAVRGHVKLGGELEGHFCTFDGADLWIGRYTVQKEAARARMQRLPLRIFDDKDGATIDERDVRETIAIPPLAQGAAFSGDTIWISASSSRVGTLYRLDRRTGRVLRRHDTLVGIEGIAFDDEGQLWAVSESGAKKYLHWPQRLPIIVEMDVGKLK